jgi:formylglycine-generating enzyme required for sulfatase activity
MFTLYLERRKGMLSLAACVFVISTSLNMPAHDINMATSLTESKALTTFSKQSDEAHATEDSTDSEQLSVVLGPLSGMEYVVIPSGEFRMGSPSTEPGRDEQEGPRHTVTIETFELMTTEVTFGMWEEIMGSLPEYDPQLIGGSTYPVVWVTWNDCQEFIDEMNYKYSDYIYRLPTEAEWEYACRAGTVTPYYWGDSMNRSYCWYQENSSGVNPAHPVAQRLPNAWGLFDMSGNAREFCEDDCAFVPHNYEGISAVPEIWADADGAPLDGSAWVQPDSSWGCHIIRGGGWNAPAEHLRSAARLGLGGEGKLTDTGFRLARTLR